MLEVLELRCETMEIGLNEQAADVTVLSYFGISRVLDNHMTK